MLHKAESWRLHLEAMGECRTCSHWDGDRHDPESMSVCNNPNSALAELVVIGNGDCRAWDSFDTETALAVWFLDQTEETA